MASPLIFTSFSPSSKLQIVNNQFPPLQSQMKSTQEENRLAGKKQHTQIVTRGRRGEVRIAKKSGLCCISIDWFKYKYADPSETQKWSPKLRM